MSTLPPRTPTADRRRLLIIAAVLGVVVVVGLFGLFIAAARWVLKETAKADPIPGITIVVDPGGAVDKERVEHAAHAYLNRRLREAGYDQPGVGPLRIDVTFTKTGTMNYADGSKTVSVDKVRVDVKFHDAAGKHLKTIRIEPKMAASEEFNFDAEISLNKTVYGRAVGELLHIDLPRPAALGRR